MATKNYRLKVRKIPLPNDIIYKSASFPYFKELHLDLLENKNKLKKNAPKPIFVRNERSLTPERESFNNNDEDDDFTLEELEKSYRENISDDENIISDSEPKKESKSEPQKSGEYQQQYFDKEEEEVEDEEERERKDKADLLFKFMVLKRQYPKIDIPEFTEHSDINTMKRVYEQVIRRVSLDSSVDNYKQYIVGGFMVLEWVSTNWLGIDLTGFTQQQIKMMNRYDRLLIELGEKNYSTQGSRFPVEIRLLFLIVFNAGLFYVQKMIFSGGSGGGNILNGLFDTMNPADQQTKKKSFRRRNGMRGPTITPQEVEEITKGSNSENDSF